MQAGTFHEILAPLWVRVILCAALWCLMSVASGSISGWFALSRRFKRRSDPQGFRKTVEFYDTYLSLRLRWWFYYNLWIRLTAASDAFYVSMQFPILIAHPPLRIPWDEIRCSRTKNFAQTWIVLTLGNEEQIPMRISERWARELGILDRLPTP